MTTKSSPLQQQRHNQLLGYSLALLSAAVVASTFIVSKTALNFTTPETFSVLWYGAAFVYALIYKFLRQDTPLVAVLRQQWRPLLGIALTNAAAAVLWFTEIQMANPALVSFFDGMRTPFVVLLGVLFLGERLKRREWVGTVIILAGLSLITYKADQVILVVFIMALFHTFLHASSTIIAKWAIINISPLALTLFRAGGMSFLILVFALLTGRWQWPPLDILALTIIGAAGGPFISYFLFYRALALIDVSKASLIGANRPAFVLLYSLIFLGSLPLTHQIVGGLLSLSGVFILISARQNV